MRHYTIDLELYLWLKKSHHHFEINSGQKLYKLLHVTKPSTITAKCHESISPVLAKRTSKYLEKVYKFGEFSVVSNVAIMNNMNYFFGSCNNHASKCCQLLNPKTKCIVVFGYVFFWKILIVKIQHLSYWQQWRFIPLIKLLNWMLLPLSLQIMGLMMKITVVTMKWQWNDEDDYACLIVFLNFRLIGCLAWKLCIWLWKCWQWSDTRISCGYWRNLCIFKEIEVILRSKATVIPKAVQWRV